MGPLGCSHAIVACDHVLLSLGFMNVWCLGKSEQKGDVVVTSRNCQNIDIS